ncbi:flavodoxin [Ruminococcus sp.]|uniref:flavodoxin n=1 Tax=Ruminococcus sp. TaxID=41978 RepID=UPI0025E4A76D|nr:flavodoxin [Ruminococcus sp.]
MSKKLVAYFSVSGVTKKLAEKIAALTEADLFEIKPQVPYTDADVNWKNPISRCNKEKIARKDVPISGTVSDMADYDVIYLGFPIWYWAAPNIINTFVKSYDLSGKKIMLFATSGGSDMGKTAEKLKPFMNGGEILDGKVFNGTVENIEIKNWAIY